MPKSAPKVPDAAKILAEKKVLVPHAPAQPMRLRRNCTSPSWRSPLTWLPLIALAMLLAGLWQLVPRGPDPTFAGSDRTLPTVVVDAGHGGKDSGAMRNGLREKDLTLDTALRLERQLRNHGFPVVLTRRDDRYISLEERARIANRIPRAVFVSVHFNAHTAAVGEGVETFYAVKKEPVEEEGWHLANLFKSQQEASPLDHGESFAEAVQATLVTQLNVTNRGAKAANLAVVRLTRCPAVLVEGGFLNNPAEARKLAQADYRERIATAVADGVIAYLENREKQERAMELVKLETPAG